MKRIIKPLLLMFALSALLCVSAFAESEAGLCDVVAEDDYASALSFSYYKADGTAVTETITVDGVSIYNETVKLDVCYDAATQDNQYVILVTNTELTSGAEITDATVEYIDQKAADDDGVTFTVYQKDFDIKKTYYIYLSSDASTGIQSRTLVGTYRWYEAAPAYTLGDVNGDEATDVSDASRILDHVVKRITLTGNDFLAADVTKDGTVDVSDASRILDYVVKRITSFE